MNDEHRKYGPTMNLVAGLGVFFGIVSWATLFFDSGDRLPALLVVGIVIACPIGALVAFICGILAVPWLSAKNARQSGKWLIVSVTPVTVASAVLAEFDPSSSAYFRTYAVLILPPALAFILTCLVLNRTLPDTHKAGHCQKCGYNLTENVSGVCPECGVVIEKACCHEISDPGTSYHDPSRIS